MKKQLLVTAVVAMLGATHYAHAQAIGPSTLNAAGGSGTIGSNSFDWSVGELALVSTFSSTGIVVTQGVLQPADEPLDVAQVRSIAGLQVYPNPASDVVNIEYAAPADGSLTYSLMDVAGKLIERNTISSKQGLASTKVNVAALPNATYMLQVTCNNEATGKQATSFKIQKVN